MSEPPQTASAAKQTGSTPTERVLARLCHRTFLGLWAYPNVFRDQGKVGGGDGKEICDLLVVFGDDVLVFSDKACAFPEGPADSAWRRWYKRAIYTGTRQLYGAERWLKKHPDRVFLDRRCKQRFPIDLPPPDRMRVHRVVVALGAADACLRYHGGTSGSLMLAPKMVSPLEQPAEGELESKPFVIGRGTGEFVHVLDDVTLSILLTELDTIGDFTRYLNAKEVLIAAGHLGFSAGEEHLLAAYLISMVSTGTPFPSPPPGGHIAVMEDMWPGLASEATYRDYRDSLRPSYGWDQMIQLLSEDVLANRMTGGNERGPAGHEFRCRALASAPRLVRRDLVLGLMSLIRSTTDATHYRAVRHPMQPDTAYILLLLRNDGLDQQAYRRTRGSLLTAYCLAFARRNRDVRHVVGIGTGHAGTGDDRSHEVVYVDGDDWREEDEALAVQMEREFDIYREVKESVFPETVPGIQPDESDEV